MQNFENNLRKARKEKGFKSSDVVDKLGISKSVLSYWETGKYEPDCKSLMILADLYDTTIDYLVGRSISMNPFSIHERKTGKIEYSSYKLLNGDSAYSEEYGWFLINSISDYAIFSDGTTRPLKTIKDAFTYNRGSYLSSIRCSIPLLKKEEMLASECVWVEPICPKDSPFKQLAGSYAVRKELGFVENNQGNRFSFDGYKGQWIAFHTKNIDALECEEFLDLYQTAYDEGYDDGMRAGENAVRAEYEDYEEMW